MLVTPKTRVLVVDDDSTMAKFLSSYLARRDFEVSTASTGEEAIRVFRVYDPSLVLLDMSMPGMDGIDTLERIKQIKPEVSVIMVSGQSTPELIFRASKLGADDYIAKPFEPRDLDQRINKLIDRQRLSTEVTQTARSGAADRPTSTCCSAPVRKWKTLKIRSSRWPIPMPPC